MALHYDVVMTMKLVVANKCQFFKTCTQWHCSLEHICIKSCI